MIDLESYGKIGGGDIAGGLGAATSIAGGIIGAIGAWDAAAAQSKAYLQNARTQGENAGQARYTARRNQLYADYQQNRLIGQQRADYGAAGVAPGSGTPLDIMADTENQAKFEAYNRWYAGEQQAKSAGRQAGYDAENAKAAREAGDTAATGSIIGGIGNALKLATAFL